MNAAERRGLLERVWFPDLGTETQILSAPFVRAVGWLDAQHEHPRGPTPPEVRARLTYFAKLWGQSVQALGLPAAGGPHCCELCSAYRASGNFGIPSGDVLYVCPEMIAHYVSVHDYLPPAEFLDAMTKTPGPGSIAYAARIARFRPAIAEQFERVFRRAGPPVIAARDASCADDSDRADPDRKASS